MTNKDKVTDAEIERLEKKHSLTVRLVRGAIEKLNSGLSMIGAGEIPLDETIEAIEAGTLTPNSFLG